MPSVLLAIDGTASWRCCWAYAFVCERGPRKEGTTRDSAAAKSSGDVRSGARMGASSGEVSAGRWGGLVGVELEARNLRLELRAVRAPELVVAFHVTERPAQHAEALVLVRVAGREHRHLADDALAFHFTVAGDLVVDVPVSPQQLRGVLAHVLDPDAIHEHVPRLHRVGM